MFEKASFYQDIHLRLTLYNWNYSYRFRLPDVSVTQQPKICKAAFRDAEHHTRRLELNYGGRAAPAAPSSRQGRARHDPSARGRHPPRPPPAGGPAYLARWALKSRGPAAAGGRLSSCRCDTCASARSPSRYSSTSGAPRASGSGSSGRRPPRFFPPVPRSPSSRGGGWRRSRCAAVARSRQPPESPPRSMAAPCAARPPRSRRTGPGEGQSAARPRPPLT